MPPRTPALGEMEAAPLGVELKGVAADAAEEADAAESELAWAFGVLAGLTVVAAGVTATVAGADEVEEDGGVYAAPMVNDPLVAYTSVMLPIFTNVMVYPVPAGTAGTWKVKVPVVGLKLFPTASEPY